MSLNISVGAKPATHPFYNKGSKYCFYINGVAGANLELIVGQSYQFIINATGHPFYLTTSESGGSEDNTAINGFNPTDNGTVTYTVPDNLPPTFYYQCKIHQYMGGVAHTKSHNTFYAESIIQMLVAPTSMSYDAKNPSIIYIADQPGIVYKYDTNNQNISVFLDVTEYVPPLNANYDERGLLGLCFHPQFSTNGRFYIFYSSNREYDNKTNKPNIPFYNCLSEFVFQDGGILYEAEKVVLRIPKDLPSHNAGKIGFGPDGFLYVTIGDGGKQTDPDGNGQNLATWFGKILRIDINIPNRGSGAYYQVPQDNPFINVKGALPEIWAYGFRNPWGLEFYDNVLIVTDAGYESGTGQEEVNVVIKGGNYGWNIKEGNNIAPWTKNINKNLVLIDPAFSYTTSDPNFCDSNVSTIIGGYVDKSGDYICADYSGRLIRLRCKANIECYKSQQSMSMEVIETASLGKWIRSFGKVNDKLYVLASSVQGPSGTSGEIYELEIV